MLRRRLSIFKTLKVESKMFESCILGMYDNLKKKKSYTFSHKLRRRSFILSMSSLRREQRHRINNNNNSDGDDPKANGYVSVNALGDLFPLNPANVKIIYVSNICFATLK